MFWNKKQTLLKGLVTPFNKNISLVRQLEIDIEHLVKCTDEETNNTLYILHSIMFCNNLSYEEAVKTEEGKEALYQLLLHKQWISFNIQLLRMERSKADNFNVHMLGYKKSSDNQIMKAQMSFLLDQFTNETSDFFKSEIKEQFELIE
ncbi:hypothetical protein C0W59_19080 [Photobacterium kishitanii]|uniref:hypothetical protein n=1 Tax=Photobacterium kishitanii TaxID=318456 RepID=UPI000D172D84|nr:hypothetical protein [Photobacterium kishitanii]PSV11639.1 hypothetical protein C0W59_19080 [Photobacterium kishitanii]